MKITAVFWMSVTCFDDWCWSNITYQSRKEDHVPEVRWWLRHKEQCLMSAYQVKFFRRVCRCWKWVLITLAWKIDDNGGDDMHDYNIISIFCFQLRRRELDCRTLVRIQTSEQADQFVSNSIKFIHNKTQLMTHHMYVTGKIVKEIYLRMT